jgi:hypothetical protein
MARHNEPSVSLLGRYVSRKPEPLTPSEGAETLDAASVVTSVAACVDRMSVVVS